MLTSSALHSFTFSLPSHLVVLGDIVEWLWFIFTFQAFALLSLSLAVCWGLKLKGNLRTLCSHSQSAHCTVTLHAEFALTQRNKIIKDSCKTKKEISIVQGHYKGSVHWEVTLRWMSNIVITVIVFCPCVEGRSQQYKIVGKITADGAMLLCRRTLWAHNSKLRLPSTSYYKHKAVLEVKNLQIYDEK